MTSARQIAANRRNAALSTGPRSAKGKARSSRNALRHGFAISYQHVPAYSDKVERLARAIAPSSNPTGLEHARNAAEAELKIRELRSARTIVINRINNNRAPFRHMKWARRHTGGTVRSASRQIVRADRVLEAMIKAAACLMVLDRYEREARRIRNRSIRALNTELRVCEKEEM